jgi:prefoldin subunit 5
VRIKTNEIDAGTTKMEELNAEIEQCNVDIRSLTARIEELDEDVGRWNKDRAAATAVRDKEAVDFKATVSDYAESLEALAGAIQVLKKQDVDRPQAALIQSLVQVSRMSLVPISTKKALAAFLQQPVADSIPDAMPADNMAVSAPEANAYEFQSGGVVDMLVKLEDEFKTKKADLEEEELKAQHAFTQIMQQLADNIENAEHEINKKTTLRAETEQQKAEAKGDLEATRQERSEDMTYKADTEALCAQKTADFNARQKLRGEELEAIKKAMEIIGSGAVKGSGEKHLPALLQTKKSALAQLRSSQQSPLQSRIADFLAERARVTGSSLLAQVSTRVAADPFKKVKKMIKDLISKLTQEATEEAEQKGWCDTEVTTNTQTRNKKTEEVNTLNSEIEDLTATIAQLTQDIADLTSALKQLADTMAKESSERAENKAENEQTISDSKAAQTAVEEAMAVLKDFYAKAAEATAFTQQPAEDAPETFSKPYTGLLPEGGNVVDFLEVILADFARLESETSTDEAMESEEYKNFMFESEKDQALKQNEMKHKTETKTAKESALHSAQEELKLTQEALDKAVAYYEKLKPTCVDTGISYEERVKRREAEMQSLQEALKILSGTDVDVA